MRVGLTLICQFVRSSSSHHRPWQIALGITIGLLIGLLPKTTALFAVVGILGFFMPVHLPLLALTAFVVTFATPLLEAPLGQLGLWSLTHPRTATFWFKLDRFPLIPWLGIHNSVVHGSLMLWLGAAFPAYACCLALGRVFMIDGVQQEVASIVDSFQLINEPAATIIPPKNQQPRSFMGPLEAGAIEYFESPTAPPVVVWDDITYGKAPDQTKPLRFELDKLLAARSDADFEQSEEVALTTDEVRQRAADLAAWAEDLISEELLLDNRPTKQYEPDEIEPEEIESNPVAAIQGSEDQEERWLIETTMEVVRIAERAVTNQAAMKAKQTEASTNLISTEISSDSASDLPSNVGKKIYTSNSTEDSTVNHPQTPFALGSIKTPHFDANSLLAESAIRREQPPHTDHRSHLVATRPNVNAGGNRPREEALHYLLRHLKGIQEKAQQQ